MADLVANCPRCGAEKITFDLKSYVYQNTTMGWSNHYESFCVCRNCNKSTIFKIHGTTYDAPDIESIIKGTKGSVNKYMTIDEYVSVKDNTTENSPEYMPPNIEEIFREGIICKSVGCFNASGAMFRLCLDLATKDLLPEVDDNGLNNKIRRSLGLRLDWLFKYNIIPNTLIDLASCIKDDGNDGAHEGTLSKVDVEDIYDFTYVLLERLYTEPRRIQLANERRTQRRSN